MGFNEKSSWIVLVGMIGMLAWHLINFLPTDGYSEGVTGVLFVGVVGFIVVVIVGHTVAAIFQALANGGKVDDRADERDRRIGLLGERAGGFVLGVAVLMVIGFSLMADQPFIASMLFLGMVVAEIVKNLWQVILYRRSA